MAEKWLFGKLDTGRIKQVATYQYPSEEMHAYTVKKGFWNEYDPTAPADYDDIPELVL